MNLILVANYITTRKANGSRVLLPSFSFYCHFVCLVYGPSKQWLRISSREQFCAKTCNKTPLRREHLFILNTYYDDNLISFRSCFFLPSFCECLSIQSRIEMLVVDINLSFCVDEPAVNTLNRWHSDFTDSLATSGRPTPDQRHRKCTPIKPDDK